MKNSSALTILFLILVFAGQVSHASPSNLKPAAIFGNDDRGYAGSFATQSNLATGTALALLTGNYKMNPSGGIDLEADTLDQLCSDERFYAQPSIEYACTGFLVAPDILATAGHCLYAANSPGQQIVHSSENACKSFDWLFDYQTNLNGQTQLTRISTDKLFHCKEILFAVQEEVPPYRDFGLVRLDHPAAGRAIFTMSNKALTANMSLTLLGHPYGLPLVTTTNNRIFINNPARQSFITNLNAFEGDSGGPVLDSQNNAIGILISGTPQLNTYVDAIHKCERWNSCKSDGTGCARPDLDTSRFPGFQGVGSEVQRIGPVIEALKNLK